MEHPLSAYYHEIAHGAELIMLQPGLLYALCGALPGASRPVYRHGQGHGQDRRQGAHGLCLSAWCGPAEGLWRGQAEDVRLRHYAGGVPKFVDNARSTMGILFKLDRLKLTDEDLVKIYTESYR